MWPEGDHSLSAAVRGWLDLLDQGASRRFQSSTIGHFRSTEVADLRLMPRWYLRRPARSSAPVT